MVNVFICHTPFHNFICSRLCDEQFASAQNLILSSHAGLQSNEKRRVVTSKRGILNRIIGLNRARLMLLMLAVQHRGSLEIFVPHIDAVLGNYAFHSWLLRVLGARISFYYDGLLMLDNHRSSRVFPRFWMERTFLSLTIFHLYRFHKDILPVNSPRVAGVYTPIVQFTPGPREKLHPLALNLEMFKPRTGMYVVLGTDVGSPAIQKANARIVDYILANGAATEVLFKPHYSAATYSFEEAAASKGLAFTHVNDRRCIEEIISDLKPEFLLAPYLSSALINIKLLCKESIDVVCLAHEETLFFSGKENADIAAGFGIKILSFS